MSSIDHLSELESLRLQVADLARELAEREQSMRAQSHHFEETMQDLRERSHLLHTIIEGTAAETGDEFFASLVMHLTSALRMQYAVIGEVCEGRKIRTLAVAAGGTFVDNFEYELAHTPCATALTQTFACFDRDLQATFPLSQRLADLGAESYCAVRLRSKGGVVTGLLVVMDTKPLQQGDNLQSLLEVFAPRVAVEIDRRRAEQERAQALTDLHNVIETIPDIVFALDRQGNLMKWNRRLEVVTGYSPEELLSKPASAFVPLEEQFRTAAAIQRVFTEGYAELDGQMLTKDFRIIPYHWTGALLKNALGEPIGITGVGRDVSEKKQAEEKLTQQRRHLVDAQALAHLGSWDWDIDTGEVQWSDELFRIFGHEPGSIHVTYDTFLAALLPDDHDRVLAAINAALAGKISYDIEYHIVRPNSEVRSIHARGDVYRDATGHPLSMAGTALDITERKRIEDALRASEERLALAVTGSTDILWDAHRLPGEPWHAPQTPIWWSPRVRELLGLEESESFETLEQWAVRLHPDDKDRVFGQLAAHIEHRVPYDAEYRLCNNRGDYLWIRGRGQASWDEQGEIRRMSGSCQDITERKRADEAVLESRQQLQAVVEGTSDAVYVKDAMGRYLLFNSAAGRFVGKNAAEVVGHDDTFIFSHTDAQVVMEGDRAVMAGGQTLSYEEHLTTADGERRTFHSTKGPWLNADGQVAGLFGVARDITERNQAEEAIREAELRYRTIFEQAGAGVAQIESHTGRFVQVNRRYCEIVGLPEEEMLTTTFGVLTHPDDLPNDLENMTRLLRGEIRSFTMEKRYVRPDGGIVWVNLNVAPLWRPGEQAIHHIAIVEDITDRKRADEALRKSEERYARATAAGKAGVWELDVVTGTYHGDPNLKALFGYVDNELSTDPDVWLNLVHPDDQAIALDHWQRIVNGESDNCNYELRMLKKDGTVIWTDVRGDAVRDHEGQVTHLFGATVDISERKQAEQGLRFFRTLLDHVDDSIEIIDPQSGRFLDGNAKAASNLGYTRDELLALTVPDIDPLITEPVFADFVRRLREGIAPLVLDSIHRRKDGTTFPVEVSVQLIRLDKEYLVAIVRDTTERMQAKITLRQGEERYRSLVDNAPIGIFLNEGGRFAYVNREMQRILNATSVEQLIGTPVLDRVAPEFHNMVKERSRTLMDNQQPVPSLDEQYVRLDGSRVDVAVTAIPASIGDRPMMQVLVLDIAERKRVEEALRQRERELRTALEERERISQDLHDGILQSLFAVGLTLEVSKSMMSPGNRKTAGPPLDQAIGQLNCVMREIRNFIAGLGSDLLKGKDLQSALQHMLDSLTQNQATHVRLAVEDRAAQAVSVEQSLHLLLVIQEAVSNCIRHGRAQEATVSLKMLKQGIRLSVRDNGRGFNPEAATGTGHGLANMAVRARKIGGRFTVMSKVNEGTRIVLDLPKEASDVLR